jgi:hypothetical protein
MYRRVEEQVPSVWKQAILSAAEKYTPFIKKLQEGRKDGERLIIVY